MGGVTGHLTPAVDPIDSGQVHVWRAELGVGEGELQSLAGALSADERARAERFYFERDRRHFVAARGVLRWLLAAYLDWEPQAVRFEYGPYGKPALARPERGLCFNLSHSHGLALFAFCRGHQVGVDLEKMRPDVDGLALAERFFSRREVAALRALPARERRPAFWRGWTRKEAYLKGRGDGLALPLHGFSVSLGADRADLLEVEDDPGEAARWTLASVAVEPGYAAALAVAGSEWGLHLRAWQWPD